MDPYRAALITEILMGLMPWSLRQAVTGGPSKQAHAYAAQNGSYKGLSHWTSQPEEKTLWRDHPTNAGCDKGGSIGLNPTVQSQSPFAREPSAIELAGIIASRSVWRRISRPSNALSPQNSTGHMKLQACS